MIPSSRPLTALALAAFLAVAGCAASQAEPIAPAKPTAPPAASVAALPPAPLHDAILSLGEVQDPLLTLPADIRSALSEFVGQLSAEQRSALMTPDDPIIGARPLLHLALGGRELAAFRAIVASSVGSDELVQLRLSSRRFDDLVEVSNSLVKASAHYLLRSRAPAVAPGVTPDAAALEDIALGASTLRAAPLEVLALRWLDSLDERKERRAALALVEAEAGNVEAARELAATLAKSGDVYPWLQQALAAAEVIRDNPTPVGEQVVGVARAHLRLAHEERALEVLALAPELAESHLGYATARVRAQMGGTTCPTVLRANAILCRVAWQKAQKDDLFTSLKPAWLAGAGRDTQSVEAYLGLSFVLPMMYRVGPQGEEVSPEVFLGYLEDIENVAAQAQGVSPDFQGVAGFAAALHAAFSSTLEASDAPRTVIEAKRRQALLQRATVLIDTLGQRPWGQAGALAALSLLSQDESVAAQLKALKPSLLPEMETTFGALSVWTALADQDTAGFQELRPLLASVAKGPLPGYERSRWLVLWAEAEGHMFPGEKSYSNLEKMSERLVAKGMPTAERLRAALNLAGLHARRGESARAIQQLDAMIAEVPRSSVSSQDEQELLVAVHGYLLTLRALQSTGEARKEQTMKLEELLLKVNAQSAAPPTLQMWLALWRGELESLIRQEGCGGNTACVAQAKKSRGISRKTLQEALGERTATLMEHGVVPIGGVQLEFSYQSDGRLRPVIRVDPSFPLVHVPAL